MLTSSRSQGGSPSDNDFHIHDEVPADEVVVQVEPVDDLITVDTEQIAYDTAHFCPRDYSPQLPFFLVVFQAALAAVQVAAAEAEDSAKFAEFRLDDLEEVVSGWPCWRGRLPVSCLCSPP